MSDKLPFGADYVINSLSESGKEKHRERIANLEHNFGRRINALLELIRNFPDDLKALPEYPLILKLVEELAQTFDKHRQELAEDDPATIAKLEKIFQLLPDKIKKQVKKELKENNK